MERNAIRITCLALMAMAGVCFADIVYVTTNGVGGGASWGAAASLANGLTVCQDGDQLWIEGGMYAGITFTISSNNITLYGGFTNGMSTLGERNWTNHSTFLDGEGTRRVVSITSTNLVMDGLTIRNGYPSSHGGGLYKDTSGFLAMANCTIVSNGIAGQPRSGYGCYFSSCSVTMTDCAIADNGRNDWDIPAPRGFGIYASDVNLIIDSCIFSTNSRGPADLSKMRAGYGGAFCCSGGSLVMSNSTFVGNRVGPDYGVASGGGAGYIGGSCSATIRNCSFSDNQSMAANGYSASGGALLIAVDGVTTVTVENCTMVDNKASRNGGAFAVSSGNLVVKNCTMADNEAVEDGGVLYMDGGNVALQNSILWSNIADAGDEIYKASGTASVEYCCLTGTENDDVYGTVSLSVVITNDPLFVAGFTDLHLMSTSGRWDVVSEIWTNDVVQSPCIDSGGPNSDYSDEPDYNGGRINMGAYGNTARASKSPPPVAPVLTNRAPAVTYNAATLKGELVAGTASDITFWYGTNQSVLDLSEIVAGLPQTGAVFTVTIGNLATNAQYWYTCFATNPAGTNWASPYTNFLTTTPPGGGSAIIHVDTDASSPVETGGDWFNAYKTVAAGIAAATAGTNELWIADGLYTLESELTIQTNASIYGGFLGTETARAQRSLTNEVSISGRDTFRVMTITGTNVVLDGLTVRDGYPSSHGGGIYKDTGGSLFMANCTIVSNHITGQPRSGYGCYFSSCSVTMTNCMIVDNGRNDWDIPAPRGFGIYASDVNLLIDSCMFSTNSRGTADLHKMRGGYGGAFYCTGGSLVMSNSTFMGNRTGADYGTSSGGGAGYIGGTCSALIRNCSFSDNATVSSGGYGASGGALYIGVNSATTVTVENCTLTDNAASENGGAFWALSGNLVVKNCTMVDNEAVEDGGALHVDGGTVEVQNSILWSNLAVDGDDIYKASGTASVEYCCLTGTGDDDVYGTVSLSLVITNDPLFVGEFTDLHLQSTSGRWDTATSSWTNDAVLSPCIDSGSPVSDYSDEPAYNGERVNMGAYGNTAHASKSPPAVVPMVTNRAPAVTYNAATLKGELIGGSASDITFWYGTNQLTLDISAQAAGLPQTGAVFTVTIGNLATNAQYWYTCFATNPAGTNWASPYTNFLTTAPPGGGSAVIHVDKDASSPVETGGDWFNAYKTLAAGFAMANAGTNEIWVAAGLYILESELTIQTNANIYGGFVGTETAREQRALTNEVLISGRDTMRVMTITGTNVVLDGLTIRDGYPSSHGGGIYKDTGGFLGLANCTIVSNHISGQPRSGYGCYFSSCSVTMTNCTIADNGRNAWDIPTPRGFGIYASDVNLIIDGCVFSTNSRGTADLHKMRAGYGGAFWCSGGSLIMSNSTFVGNRTGADYGQPSGGGAGYIGGTCPALIRNCSFSDNATVSSGGYGASGGAVLINVDGATTVMVENCTLAGNHATENGGAFWVRSGNLVIKNAILWTNTATLLGDELYATNCNVTISYSDLSGTNATHVENGGGTSVAWGTGIMTADPLFAVEYTDLHLKSRFGRWAGPGTWVADDYISPCIDAGDPDSAYSLEPLENGGTINLGAYGNTLQASKSPSSGGSVFIIW